MVYRLHPLSNFTLVMSLMADTYSTKLGEWGVTRSLAYLGLLVLAAQLLHVFIKKYLVYKVWHCKLVLVLLTDFCQADCAFGARHGCQPCPELTKKWPLGVDRLRQLWQSNSDGRLLAFLCSLAKDYPHNMGSQYLLVGPRAFHNLSPKNVEAMLSTDFKGKVLRTTNFFTRALILIIYRQTMALEPGRLFLHPSLAMGFLLRRVQRGNTLENC